MKKLPIVIAMTMVLAMFASPVIADDGQRLVRSVSSPPGVTEDPESEGEHAFIKLMNFHVPSQAASGELVPVEYFNIDDVLVKTEEKAKPLINVYVYGPVIGFENPEASGYAGHGRRDAFGAVSLDDGETWKVTNLSNSADQSSFEVSTPLQDPGVAEGEGSAIEYDATGPTFEEVVWDAKKRGGKLHVHGDTQIDSRKRSRVEIRNAVTQDVLFTVRSQREGEFEKERRLTEAPCFIQAGVNGVFGPAVEVEDAPEECVGHDTGGETLITDYPGDVPNVFHAVAGNKVLVAWHSKFCSSGNPVWGDEFPSEDVATYLGIDNTKDLYLTDMFGAAGSQSSTNYNELGAEPVGEVPYSCLWSARGVLREDPEAQGTTQIVWFQAERLTAGARDVNRVETACVAGAGCAITWQEDPEGVRPGSGEGPGTGWSGATTASKTDIWYSFVKWEDFDIILDGESGDPIPLGDNITDSGRPTPYVPMMTAVRLTNNDRCVSPGTSGDYCEDLVAAPYGIIDQCVGSVEIPLGPQDNLQPICVVDSNNDGTMNAGDMPNLANTAASRPRLNMQPRDTDGDGVVDDAWVIVVSEEDKGLGRFGFLTTASFDGSATDTGTTGTVCELPDDESEETDCRKADEGKNVFWASFNLGSPNTSAGIGVDYSLVSNVLVQGTQLNQPEVNWRTGTYYPPMDTADMWNFDELNYLIFNTEIARRTSMMSQSLAKATMPGSNGLVAMPLWKQGIVNQGGPADISTRRIVTAMDVDEKTENPYAGSNMVCARYDNEGNETAGVMYFTDGTNPYYPNGLCMAQPINLSARTPFVCESSGDNNDGFCPGESDMTCVDDADFGQLCSSVNDPEDSQTYDKMLSWYECPGWNGVNVSNDTPVLPGACGTEDDSVLLGSNMDDVSWYNPLEVSKAHRGFLDGNHVFMIYAWSPNWKLNTVGNDRYELYTRRSFDGGVTWTTTPGSFLATDGVNYAGSGLAVTCETMRDGETSQEDNHICTAYDAGVAEQSRNVSQLKSMANTILDPRYTPTIASMPTASDLDWGLFEPIDPTDIRDPSRNFVAYEDGDNTTVTEGEAEPLNLAYGRAEMFGDYFTVWTEMDTGLSTIADCYPNNAHGDPDVGWAAGSGFCHEFDTIEGKRDELSEEASITSSANGDFLYAVWGQFNVDPDNDNEFIDGDSMFRRVWYLDDYISEDNSYTLPDTVTP